MSGDLRVLFFGDELVAGVGDIAGIGWVGRVAAECRARELPILAYNLGIVGDTTVQMSMRLAGEAVLRLAPGVDTRLVFCVTANDVRDVGGAQRLATAATLDALTRALVHAAAIRVPAIVIGPPPAGNARSSARIKTTSTGLAKLCASRGVRYVDLYTPLHARPAWASETAAGECGCPTSAAYDLLASVVIDGGVVEWLSLPAET